MPSKSYQTSVDSYKKLNHKDWNSLVSDRFYLQLDYLSALESSVSDISEFIYTIYYEDNEAIGISIFQKIILDLASYQYKDVQWKLSTNLLKKFIKKKVGILMCGNIFATGENIYNFKENISQKQIFEKLHNCIDETLKCNDGIHYVVIKEFAESSDATSLLLDEYHYHKLHINDIMRVSFTENILSIEEYCQQFTAKYRTRSNKVSKKSKELICKEFSLTEIQDNATKIEELYRAVLQKSSFNIGVFNFKTFFNLKEQLGEKYRFFAYYYNDKIIGFKSLFIFNNIVDASFIGIDYELNKQFDTYQRILIDYVKFAIENNTNKLYLGRTAETIKSCIGAEPQKMNLFIKHRNSIGCFVLNILIRFIKPSENQIRKPFKKEYYN